MRLYAFSVAGSSSPIKALRSALSMDRASFVWFPPEHEDGELGVKLGEMQHLNGVEKGYWLYGAKLGYNSYHLLGVAKDPRFLPSASDEGLWQALVKLTTTPMLREWLPRVRKELEEDNILTGLTCYNCQAGLLHLGKDEATRLDDLVAALVRGRAVKFPRL